MAQHSFILFATGARFSLAVLDQLLAQGLKPLALVLPEYAPSGLKEDSKIKVKSSANENCFMARARQLLIPIIYLPKLSQPTPTQDIASIKADFLLVACWPYLLSSKITKTVNKAALNLHPSLLPDYRGVDPITEQMQNKEKKWGVSLHLLNQKFDQGDIVCQAPLGLDPEVEFPERELIEDQAALTGVKLFSKAIKSFGGPDWNPRPQ